MATKSPYSVHPSISYVQSVIANFKPKTGRTIEEWIAFVKKEGPKNEADRRTWLKEKHELGTNYSWWIAERAEGKGEEDGVPIESLDQVDDFVAKWLKTAYEADA